jgi:hypothetical protein
MVPITRGSLLHSHHTPCKGHLFSCAHLRQGLGCTLYLNRLLWCISCLSCSYKNLITIFWVRQRYGPSYFIDKETETLEVMKFAQDHIIAKGCMTWNLASSPTSFEPISVPPQAPVPFPDSHPSPGWQGIKHADYKVMQSFQVLGRGYSRVFCRWAQRMGQMVTPARPSLGLEISWSSKVDKQTLDRLKKHVRPHCALRERAGETTMGVAEGLSFK